jgi:hypothetical protein
MKPCDPFQKLLLELIKQLKEGPNY